MFYNPATERQATVFDLNRMYNKSFAPSSKLINEGEGHVWHVIYNQNKPKVTSSQRVVEDGIKLVDGKYRRSYRIENIPKAELVAKVTAEFTEKTQNRLDTFAATKGYDNILSACSYADDADEQFAKEGQYCKQARSSTWNKFYEVLDTIVAEIKEGEELPKWESVEQQLPELAWPA